MTRTSDDRDEQARRLFRSLLRQIMVDGVFHADLHPGNVMLLPGERIALLDFGSVGRLDSELRREVGEILLTFYRGDAGGMSDRLLGIVGVPDGVDEQALRRELGRFMALHLGPGATMDVAMFADMVALLARYELAFPAELTAAFRAVAILEGTLRSLAPGFNVLTEARDFAKSQVISAFTPSALRGSVTDELAALVPMLRRIPRRFDQISSALRGGPAVGERAAARRRTRPASHPGPGARGDPHLPRRIRGRDGDHPADQLRRPAGDADVGAVPDLRLLPGRWSPLCSCCGCCSTCSGTSSR